MIIIIGYIKCVKKSQVVEAGVQASPAALHCVLEQDSLIPA